MKARPYAPVAMTTCEKSALPGVPFCSNATRQPPGSPATCVTEVRVRTKVSSPN
jgi:hypothetical protein